MRTKQRVGTIYDRRWRMRKAGTCALCPATGTEDAPIELTRTVVGRETLELCTPCYRAQANRERRRRQRQAR